MGSKKRISRLELDKETALQLLASLESMIDELMDLEERLREQCGLNSGGSADID